jgi:hypothetical protein
VLNVTFSTWPEQPVQKLGVPIPSPVTLVSMLRFPNVINWNFGPENKGIYIEIQQSVNNKSMKILNISFNMSFYEF